MALERGVAEWIMSDAQVEEVKVEVQELLQDATGGKESEAKKVSYQKISGLGMDGCN